MIKHPEALAKAQKEIDSVVGSDRLPTFADRASLPYGLYFPDHLLEAFYLTYLF